MSDEYRIAAAKEHLENKYNEEFVDIAWNNYDEYRCHPASNKDVTVKVFVEKENGETVIEDNYYGWLIRDEYTELTDKIIRQWFPDEEIKIFFNFTNSYFEYPPATSLVEAMAESPKSVSSNLWIFIAEEEGLDTDVFAAKCLDFTEALKEANYETSLKVFAIQGEHLEKSVNEDNYKKHFSKNKNRENGFLYEFRAGIIFRNAEQGIEIVIRASNGLSDEE